jgi:hypothetical protein
MLYFFGRFHITVQELINDRYAKNAMVDVGFGGSVCLLTAATSAGNPNPDARIGRFTDCRPG